jgi:hypothetical protein
MALSAIPNTFSPGVPSTVFLPVNGREAFFSASLTTSLSGTVPLADCYDKYGLQWKWSTFELSALSALSSTRTPYPSSWSTVQCLYSAGSLPLVLDASGPYPKKWRSEGSLSAELFNPSILFTSCTAAAIYWTLSTARWVSDTWVIPISASQNYIFSLKLEEYGLNDFTASIYQDTLITIIAETTGTCYDLAVSPASSTPAFIYETFTFKAIAPPLIKIYTPNRYVLTGTNVNFENLITNLTYTTAIRIDLDDSKEIYLTGSNITNSFSASYNVVGNKTLKVTSFLNYTSIPYTVTLPNIIEVVQAYDTVSPREYRSEATPIELPYTERPKVGSNDWVVEDNINNCFTKIYQNLEYLESRGKAYIGTYSDYFGYLGSQPNILITGLTGCPTWTWEDLDCLNTSLPYNVTWRDVYIPPTSATDPTTIGSWVDCGTWEKLDCKNTLGNPNCNERYCVDWNWRARKLQNSLNNIPTTWLQTVSGGQYQKRWYYEPCDTSRVVICDEGVWNVNIPNLNTYYEPIPSPAVQQRCIYTGVVSKQNRLYTSLKTLIKLLDSDYTATYYSYRDSFDGVLGFSNIKNICMDSENKIYILDSILSQVGVYTYEPNTPGEDWNLFTSWGGFGTAGTTNRFSNPNDLHIDQFDNIWVTDTGNGCIKHYSNTGTWLNTVTDEELKNTLPLSVAVDSEKMLHVLTEKEIRVYTYNGIYKQSYSFKQFATSSPVRINTSYNREVVYVAFTAQVLKFFRNGIFAGYIIQEKQNLPPITSLYQDEYRNLLVTAGDKILKYPDLMTQKLLKGTTPSTYWSLQDIFINKEEYVQNWVYTKAFQRMWDNIEIFRSSLLFENSNPCKQYQAPIHGKEKMIIGQNEIVTSTVINRVLNYLWDNFETLLDYFDPSCQTTTL